MPINKPIPDSVINYWKKVFQSFQAKISSPKKSVWYGHKNNFWRLMNDLVHNLLAPWHHALDVTLLIGFFA